MTSSPSILRRIGTPLLLIFGATLAHAQSLDHSRPVDIGIIVTPTAQQAQAVLTKLRAGWDFAVLAKENSLDPSANSGGYFGRLSPSQLQTQLSDALAALHPGDFSPVLETKSGFAILTVFKSAPPQKDPDGRQIQSMAHAGVVRYGIDVGGMMEADAVFTDAPKPDGWNKDLHQVCEIRKHSLTDAEERIQQKLTAEQAQPNVAPLEQLRDHLALGQLFSYQGNMKAGIDQYEQALEMAKVQVPDGIAYFEEVLAVSYFHWSEMENGAYRGSADLDLFPPTDPTSHFQNQEHSQRAIEHFLKYLETKPDDLQARWLINLAYASIGKYPAGVPPTLLIPPSAFQSKQDIGRFKDIAPDLGVNAFLSAGGAIVDDFENNGLLDIVVSSSDVCDPLHYFHNNGDGTFTDLAAQAGLADQLGGLNIIEGDYNNDGCMDLLVLRGGWQFGVRKSLLRNNCNGTFTDVTQQSGLADVVTPTQSAVWADIDNDGYLDLFVANERAPAQLFHNRGDGTFEDIAHAAGVDKAAFSKAVAAADYDNDGFVDFYVSNFNSPNFLYRNNHNRTFTEIAKQAGVQEPVFSFAAWFFDYDNDGWPDLYVDAYFNSVDEVMRSYLHMPPHTETPKLYRNLHNGTFQDVTAMVGLDRIFAPMGANFGDLDNDGFLDIYLGMGNPSLGSMTPHELLRNDAGKQFVDITASSGTGDLHKGHGIAFADLFRNGQTDIVAQIAGAIPSDKHTVRVYQNPGNGNNWINVRLIGVKSNRSAVGAKIEVKVQNNDGTEKPRPVRSIWRTVGETSSFGGNPLELHIGIGPAARIVGVDIYWPATNTRQHFDQLDNNQFIEIKEFATSFTKLDRKPIPIGR